jgi:hypothetical protein
MKPQGIVVAERTNQESVIVYEAGLSNRQFFERHAAPGRIGLAGGSSFIDRGIRRVLKKQTAGAAPLWSHAFLCSGQRLDGQQWVLESDLEIHRKQVRLGVQENRAEKFANEADYPNLAILDFGLDAEQTRQVMTEALNLVSGLARYSLREIMGTFLALHRPAMRSRQNVLAREGSLYCSAFVQHCYATIGVEFVPGIAIKNTTPEDIAASSLKRQAWLLVRDRPAT